jgi:fructosamine-3-kinase
MITPNGLARLISAPVTQIRDAGGQHGYRHLIAELDDGRRAFVKASGPSQAGPSQEEAFAAEANGLRWLGESEGGAPVPGVLASTAELLAIEYLPPERATAAAAEDFGRALARTHRAGAERFGAPWPGRIASLPLDNRPVSPANSGSGEATTGWGEWYQARRIVPYIKMAADENLLPAADARLAETVAARAGQLGGPEEPPSRLHGDLWSGNVLWSGGRGWLIDPAAHGGHRESDLAMLALFGAPHLDAILAAYHAEFPLADGWRSRVPLHQLHPLLVHVCLYGGGYASQLRAAARAALRSD